MSPVSGEKSQDPPDPWTAISPFDMTNFQGEWVGDYDFGLLLRFLPCSTLKSSFEHLWIMMTHFIQQREKQKANRFFAPK